jgi:hypothetical protein
MIQFRTEFESACAAQFAPDSKIGIYCSLAPDGWPHLSLITSINVKTKTSYMWGQFSQGLSKEYLRGNAKTGFLVVSADQYWWTGKSLHTGTAEKGEDYEYYNNKPFFRYNAYCGIGRIHYENLVDVSAGEKLPALAFASGFCVSKLLRGAAARCSGGDAGQRTKGAPAGKLGPYGLQLLSKLMTLKFLAWVDSDGFPRIIPALQGTAVDADRLVFAAFPYGELLAAIPEGAKAACFLVNLDLESLLVQGRWEGVRRFGGLRGAVFTVDKVYNSMLPLNGYVYPPPGQ